MRKWWLEVYRAFTDLQEIIGNTTLSDEEYLAQIKQRARMLMDSAEALENYINANSGHVPI